MLFNEIETLMKLATTTLLVEENRQSQIKSREGAKSIGKHELVRARSQQPWI